MVARVHLTADEKTIIDRISQGWGLKLDNWTIARIALARSLQLPEAPSSRLYPVLSQQKGGVEMHAAQLTGEGRTDVEDFTDSYCAVLSTYEGTDLFSDDTAFHAALQRHVRRGLAVINVEWRSETDINTYILEQIFAERTGEDVAQESEQLGAKVSRTLGQIGVGADLIETLEGPRLNRFTFELKMLDDLDRLRRGEKKLAFALGLGDQALGFSFGSAERTVLIDIPRPASSWKTTNWPDIQPALRSPQAASMALPVCVGTDVLGSPFLFDLAEAPHLLVGGTTGSGKSMCLHSILLSLLSDPARAPELVLIDPKAVEFAAYKGFPLVIGGQPITTGEGATVALQDLVDEMTRRQEIFSNFKARDISEANEKGAKLKRIVVVVDELGDLIMTNPDIEIPLIRLAQKARSAGIHLVLATQRPEAATFSGMLRSNIPSRIALTVQKSSESRIILDATGAEDLLGRGDMLIKLTGQQVVRAHGSRVLPTDISSLR